MPIGWGSQAAGGVQIGQVQVGIQTPSGGSSAAQPPEVAAEHLPALLAMPSDAGGVRANAGFRWQAKIAVLRWLSCLGSADAPLAVVCEQVDDLAMVFSGHLVFEQLKTRDRGSWSVSGVCAKGGGLDSLTRSYTAARDAGLHTVSSFELSLEGAMALPKATRDFFTDPRSASKDVRSQLTAHGLPNAHHDDFLSRLSIRTGMPPRANIDAVLEQTIGALWPALTHPQRQSVRDLLTSAADAAQAHEEPSVRVVAALRAASTPAEGSRASDEPSSPQVLSRQTLIDLTPPLPSMTAQDVLRRLARGETSSALELKLLAAGASARTVSHAKNLRAQADVKRQQALASGGSGEDAVVELQDRILMVAGAKAGQVDLYAATPGVAARPADFIFGDLMSNPAGLAALDHENVMAGQALLVLGLLCQVSDECRFWWRA